MADIRINGQAFRETLADRLVAWARPRLGLERMRSRVMLEVARGSTGGYNAGRRDRRNLRSWRPGEGSANADALLDLPDLRARSRDLVRNTPIATGAVATFVTNVIGEGLTVTPAVDRRVLKLSDQAAEEFEATARREFGLWCATADFTKAMGFADMQALAFRSVLESGDVLAVRRYRLDPGEIYGTRLLLLEADRVSNPQRVGDRAGMIGGVEFNDDGIATGYSVSNRHPGDSMLLGGALAWQTIRARDDEGRPLALHLFDRLRVDLARGIPFLAPVIEKLAELAKYTDAEATAAIVSAMLTAFLTNADGGEDETPAIGERRDDNESNEIALGNGAVVELPTGQDVKFVNPARPNPEFDPFVTALLRQLGVGLELPYELLIKHFTASYSASRAALETGWQAFRKRRQWMVGAFCQPSYEMFMYEAVARGRIGAPGFFSDPVIMRAWCSARWLGPARISLDQAKDANADEINLRNGILTRDHIQQTRFGTTFDETLPQAVREKRALDAAGLSPAPPATSSSAPPPARPDGSDREDAPPATRPENDDDAGDDGEEGKAE